MYGTHAGGVSFVALAPAYMWRHGEPPLCTVPTLEEAATDKQCIQLLTYDYMAPKGLTNLTSLRYSVASLVQFEISFTCSTDIFFS